MTEDKLKYDRKETMDLKREKIVKLCKKGLWKLRQIKMKKSVLILAATVAFVIAAMIYMQFRVSRSYDVLSSAQKEDTQSSGYAQMGKNLLKFNNNGVSLLNQQEQVLWNRTYEMVNPNADVSGSYGVIYDKKGTSMYVIREENPVGLIEVRFPILKAEIAQNGAVAAILEDGEKTWVNYYASDGSLIAENQTSMENPGYPVDLAVAPSGESILVSYFTLDQGQISSYVACYNFGDEGQEQVDNIVAGFTYENELVPQVVWINERTAVVFRENGFSVYDGSSVPKERVHKEVEGEIVSTFYNEKYIGLVFQGGEKDEKYTMKLYDVSGKERTSESFDTEYQTIEISGDRIILCSNEQVSMYSLGGNLKFDCEMDEGTVKTIFQVASNRYIMAAEDGLYTIKTK